MAGGIFLLAVLVSLMPVPSAMFLHGLVQTVANGSRFLFIRKHIVWPVIPPYFLGTAVALLPFALLTVVPNNGIVLILIGAVTLIGVNIPKSWGLDIRKPIVSFVCGTTIGFTHLLAGTSGPALDVFFQKSNFNRFEIVATKAFTQTVAHACKMGYYLYIAMQPNWISDWNEVIYLSSIAIVVAMIGTWLGVKILHRLPEQIFQRLVPWIIRVVALVCILQGGWKLLIAGA